MDRWHIRWYLKKHIVGDETIDITIDIEILSDRYRNTEDHIRPNIVFDLLITCMIQLTIIRQINT